MYYEYVRRYNILTVNDDFAHLKRVNDDGDYEFVLYYSLVPYEALQHGALAVNVTVSSRDVAQPKLLTNGDSDPASIIGNALQRIVDAKNVSKLRASFVAAKKKSDITAWISNNTNERVTSRKTRRALKLIPVSKIKNEADSKPLLLAQVSSVASTDSPAKLMLDMLQKQGVDPSDVLAVMSSATEAGSVAGTTKNNMYLSESDVVGRLHRYYSYRTLSGTDYVSSDGAADEKLLNVLSDVPASAVEVPVELVVSKKVLDDSNSGSLNVVVKFELVNAKTNAAVDTVTKQLDIAKHVRMLKLPRVAPTIRASKSASSTSVNLEIKQVDSRANAVNVYSKRVFVSSTDIDDYALVGTYSINKGDQPLRVHVDMPINSVGIFRAVAINDGIVGHDFANAVVKPSRYCHIKSVSLVAQRVDTGVKLELRNIPAHVVSVKFVVRNLSIRERVGTVVGGSVVLINDQVRTADCLVTTDTSARPGNVYEYVTELMYDSGTTQLAGSATLEYLEPSPGKVDTRVSDVNVVHSSSPDVTFSLSTALVDTNMDVLKSLLKQQDMYDLYVTDISKEREALKNIVAHNVQRVDLTSGERENFGTITQNSFSDNAYRNNQAVKPLKHGHKYRYEVTAMLRAPETLLEAYVKTVVDPVTKKQYSYKPSKFLHPITLSRGVLVSKYGLKTLFSKDSMSHGALGSMTSFDVAFDVFAASVINASATRFSRFTNVVSWSIEGATEQIDHFLVLKSLHGANYAVGKAHSEFVGGTCMFVHDVTSNDEGQFSYVIVPVFNDYSVGAPVTTNSIIVEQFSRNVRYAPK